MQYTNGDDWYRKSKSIEIKLVEMLDKDTDSNMRLFCSFFPVCVGKSLEMKMADNEMLHMWKRCGFE